MLWLVIVGRVWFSLESEVFQNLAASLRVMGPQVTNLKHIDFVFPLQLLTKHTKWGTLFASHDSEPMIDVWGRGVKKWNSYCDYGLRTCLFCCAFQVGSNGSNYCLLHQDYSKTLGSALYVFDESPMSELPIWELISASPSEDYGLVIELCGLGVKQ